MFQQRPKIGCRAKGDLRFENGLSVLRIWCRGLGEKNEHQSQHVTPKVAEKQAAQTAPKPEASTESEKKSFRVEGPKKTEWFPDEMLGAFRQNQMNEREERVKSSTDPAQEKRAKDFRAGCGGTLRFQDRIAAFF